MLLHLLRAQFAMCRSVRSTAPISSFSERAVSARGRGTLALINQGHPPTIGRERLAYRYT
ncbi:hypothetical protein P4200_29905 [Pseudomonas aeruginosa]|nr:hypothetical protein [Pseudomonas aeruginosa]